jgi:hypothetical protein
MIELTEQALLVELMVKVNEAAKVKRKVGGS